MTGEKQQNELRDLDLRPEQADTIKGGAPDKSSPNLLNGCATGKHFDKAVITAR